MDPAGRVQSPAELFGPGVSVAAAGEAGPEQMACNFHSLVDYSEFVIHFVIELRDKYNTFCIYKIHCDEKYVKVWHYFAICVDNQ